MQSETTRRDFLKLSAAGLAATTAVAKVASATAAGAASGKINAWVTNGTLRCAAADPLAWKARAGAAESVITLDPAKTYQSMLGFGGAFTDASCFLFHQMPAGERAKLLRELFHPSEMGLNVCRVCMGSSDYSTSVFSYDDGEADPELQRFSIAHDRDYILPTLREARAVNPDLFLFGSPWSPPGWMKAGGSMLGGSMRRRYLPNYAQYFVKFLQAYQAEGVPVQAVTPQNEVDTDQDGRMPACLFPQEYEIEFVKFLGPLLEQNQMPVKIWILDHNYNLWGRAVAELDVPEVQKYANAVAWHGYVGTVEQMSRLKEYHPGAGMHWTEGGPDYTWPGYRTDWVKWSRDFIDVLRNWCESITAWNLVLDEKGRPNLGPFPCGGVVTLDSQTREVTRSGQYWALAHFARFIPRGSKRFDSQGAVPDVGHVALENPDGRRVLVLSNAAAARTVSVQMGDMAAEVRLDENSVTTLRWG